MTTETIDAAIAAMLHEGMEDYDQSEESAHAGGAIAALVCLVALAVVFAAGVAFGHWGLR